MKKLLAVIMSIVMACSIAVIPAAAAEKEITVDEFFETVETSIALIEDTINQIHYIVGTILGALDKECPMCAEIHEVEFIYGDKDENVDVEIELPEEAGDEIVEMEKDELV